MKVTELVSIITDIMTGERSTNLERIMSASMLKSVMYDVKCNDISVNITDGIVNEVTYMGSSLDIHNLKHSLHSSINTNIISKIDTMETGKKSVIIYGTKVKIKKDGMLYINDANIQSGLLDYFHTMDARMLNNLVTEGLSRKDDFEFYKWSIRLSAGRPTPIFRISATNTSVPLKDESVLELFHNGLVESICYDIMLLESKTAKRRISGQNLQYYKDLIGRLY